VELKTRPLGENFGREVADIALAEACDEAILAIRRLWQREPLLLFRRQTLTDRQLADLGQNFGVLETLPRQDMFRPATAGVYYLSNLMTQNGQRLGALSNSELDWHTDQSYRPEPATGTIFQAVEVPAGEGHTSWCNMALAYAALDDATRQRLDGRSSVARYNAYEREPSFSDAEKQRLRAEHPPVRHPLVLQHPAGGGKTLYLDISIAYGISGLSDEDAAPLLKRLAAHMTRPEFVYTHAWAPGDVMFWDNARLCHRRDAFDAGTPRLAKRTTIHLDPAAFPLPAKARVLAKATN
jgi:taurine dioxygenase